MAGRLGERNVSPRPNTAAATRSTTTAARPDTASADSAISQQAANSRPHTATARVRRCLRARASTGSWAAAIVHVLAANANPTTLRLTPTGPVAQAGRAVISWL